jgi:hypothetical protein
MRSSHTVDRVETAFDDDRLVADAGLLLPATLAQHLGLRELVEQHLNLGDKPGQANRGDKGELGARGRPDPPDDEPDRESSSASSCTRSS